MTSLYAVIYPVIPGSRTGHSGGGSSATSQAATSMVGWNVVRRVFQWHMCSQARPMLAALKEADGPNPDHASPNLEREALHRTARQQESNGRSFMVMQLTSSTHHYCPLLRDSMPKEQAPELPTASPKLSKLSLIGSPSTMPWIDAQLVTLFSSSAIVSVRMR